VRHQRLEVADHGRIHARDVGMVVEKKLLGRKLVDLNLPAIAADQHLQREGELRFLLLFGRTIIAVWLPAEIEEFVQVSLSTVHAALAYHGSGPLFVAGSQESNAIDCWSMHQRLIDAIRSCYDLQFGRMGTVWPPDGGNLR
jgi:hypothetical protein